MKSVANGFPLGVPDALPLTSGTNRVAIVIHLCIRGFRVILFIRDSDNNRVQTIFHGMTQNVIPQYKNGHTMEYIFAPKLYMR